jgi:hypothetical protein
MQSRSVTVMNDSPKAALLGVILQVATFGCGGSSDAASSVTPDGAAGGSTQIDAQAPLDSSSSPAPESSHHEADSAGGAPDEGHDAEVSLSDALTDSPHDSGPNADATLADAPLCDTAALLKTLPADVLARLPATTCLAKTTVFDINQCPAQQSNEIVCATGSCDGKPGCTAALTWHDAVAQDGTLTVLLDISIPMPISYEALDVGCSNPPSTCTAMVKASNVKYTAKVALQADAGASTDGGPPHLSVTDTNMTGLSPMRSGCGFVGDLDNSLQAYLDSALGNMTLSLVRTLQDAVESHHC